MEAWLPLGAKGAGAEAAGGEGRVGANQRKLLSAGPCFWKAFRREARSELLTINMAPCTFLLCFYCRSPVAKGLVSPSFNKGKKNEPLINAASLVLLQNLKPFLQLKMTKEG